MSIEWTEMRRQTHDEQMLDRWRASVRLAENHISILQRELGVSYRSYWNAVDQVNSLTIKIVEASQKPNPPTSQSDAGPDANAGERL